MKSNNYVDVIYGSPPTSQSVSSDSEWSGYFCGASIAHDARSTRLRTEFGFKLLVWSNLKKFKIALISYLPFPLKKAKPKKPRVNDPNLIEASQTLPPTPRPVRANLGPLFEAEIGLIHLIKNKGLHSFSWF